jgi:hypothetical protein
MPAGGFSSVTTTGYSDLPAAVRVLEIGEDTRGAMMPPILPGRHVLGSVSWIGHVNSSLSLKTMPL